VRHRFANYISRRNNLARLQPSRRAAAYAIVTHASPPARLVITLALPTFIATMRDASPCGTWRHLSTGAPGHLRWT